jgi:vacuolar protein sorting-associated protein 45
MHEAIDKIPELTQISNNVSKHVTLSCEISDQIEKRKLMEISKIEQDLVCQDNRKENIDSIWRIVKGKQYQTFDKLKLILLFSVKYPNDKELKEFLNELSHEIGDTNILNLPQYFQKYQSKRKSDLFNNSNIKKKAKSFFDNLFKDVPNVYTQHKSYLT